MAFTLSEEERVAQTARYQFPAQHPPPTPADLAACLGAYAPTFAPDPGRPTQLPPPCQADFLVVGALAVYGSPGAALPPGAVPAALTHIATPISPVNDVRAAERLLAHGALQGWAVAREVLLELIRRVIRPALRWLYRRSISETEGRWEDEWVEQEASDSAGLILQWLLEGCECHRYERELTFNAACAQTRCRTMHHLSCWDGDEPLARFLCRAAVCLFEYYRPRIDDFTGFDDYCPNWLAVNEFRLGMLAKAVIHGGLRSGHVLRCTATPGCTGEIDPTTDLCSHCEQLTKATKPQDFWLWVAGRYRPEECLLCRTCRYYYFLHQRSCPRQGLRGQPHRWSGNGPRQVWVRVRNCGGALLAYQPEPERRVRRYSLSPEGRQRFRDAIAAILIGPVRDLAAELLCEESDPSQAAARRHQDVLNNAFLQQWLEVFWAVPNLLPSDTDNLFRDDKMATLARCLLADRLTLKQAANRRGQKVNSKCFRKAVLEVLTRTLGVILRENSGAVEEDESDDAVGELDPRLLEFLAAMPKSDERDLAWELFPSPVRVDPIAEQWGFEMEAPEFVGRLLRTVRAVQPGLPFDLHARFVGGELHSIVVPLFRDEPGDLMVIEERMQEDRKYRETVLGLLLNVIYTANGLATEKSSEGEEEA